MKKIYSHLFTAIYASLALAISACSKSDGSSPSLSMDETPNTKVEIREILEVETDTVGTLAEKIGEKSSVVQKLIINGPIDAVDVRTIHSLPQLLAIDMKNATICGGDSTFTYNNTAYKLYDNEVVRYMYPSQLSEIILPDNLKAINDHAFYGHNGSEPHFTEIIIPESVERIGEYAFEECRYLQHVKLPENLQKIEANTFYRCYDLNSVELGSKLKEIGEEAFLECYDLKTIILPEGLEILGARCFESCGLTEIKIPDSVTTFKGQLDNDEPDAARRTFDGCSSLKSVTLPKNITEIYNGMFRYCTSLTSITLPETVTVIRQSAFYGCSKLSNINLPSSITGIESAAFQNCTSLKTIVFPEEATISIGGRTFQESGLTSLTLPANVKGIGTYCFYNCNKLVSVDLSNSQITSLPSYAFQKCSVLKDIKLPESLISIGSSCFSSCSALETVNIPSSVTSLGSSAFNACSSLKSVTIPNSVTTIGSSCFQSCTSLESISILDGVTTISSHCFDNCTTLKNVSLPNTLQTIETAAFNGCNSLETIDIPNTVTSIDHYAFDGCTSLKTIILPNSLNTIGNGCFSSCKGLTTITFPSSITSIGTSVISDCYNLTSIFWESTTTIPKDFSSTYSYTNRNILLYLSNPNTQVLDTDIKNIIVNGVAEEIVLRSVSNSNFFVPQEFKAIKITYTRDFSYPTYPGEAAGWRSISLPFTVTNITHSDGRVLAPFNANVTGAKPFWLRRLTENGFENVTQIEAGVPYIIAMPNNEAYDDEYNITGSVTFTAQSSQGITIPATSTLASDMGPEFVLNCNYSYIPASMTIYALNETATNTQKAGSAFVRNERAVLPFEGYVSSSASSVSASPSYYRIDNNMPVTRSNRPLGPVPTIEDM